MNAYEYLAFLRGQDIVLEADGELLKCSAPRGVLTTDVRAELARRKPELLDILHTVAQAAVQAPAPIAPVSRDQDLPLSFAQERLWFLDQWKPGNPAYNIAIAYRLSGTLHVKALKDSLYEIICRHESLRTTFSSKNGTAIQVIAPARRLDLPVQDLTSVPQDRVDDEIQRLASEEAAQPFDLSEDPLVRVKLLRCAEDDHVLLLTMHHIVSDGWSIDVFFRELGLLYDSFVKGESSPLPSMTIQYADFAYYQKTLMQEAQLASQVDYWKECLKGRLNLIDLPTDNPRPAVQTFNGSYDSTRLERDLTDRLHALGRDAGCSLFMTLLALFYTLLHRYSGQDDIIIGSPVANRNRVETENIVGFFVNTLPLRIDGSADPAFREILDRVRKTTLDAYANQDVPFEKIVEELHPDRDVSRSSVFDVMFVFNTPQEEMCLGDLEATEIKIDNGSSKFDLTLYATEEEDGLDLDLEYNSDLFDSETVQRMLRHFKQLTREVLDDPGRPLSGYSLMDTQERDMVVNRWNDTSTTYPGRSLLHQLVEEQVKRTPAHPAVIFENQSISYETLNLRANQLARLLRSKGVGANDLVAVYMERSVDLVVGLLAILKAGGAYVPLDPEYPAERIAFMVGDCRAPMMLTQQKLLKSLPEQDAEVIPMDGKKKPWSDELGDDLSPVTQPGDLAYVIYTSGSTGKPKGVMNTHRGVRNRLLWMQDAFKLDTGDRVLQKTPFSFDVSVWEFFWPLMTGAGLVMARPGGHKDSDYLATLIEKEKVTTLHFVPSMLSVFLEEKNLDRCAPVKRVICSGEALSLENQQRFFDRMQGELHNLYGPTEAAIDVTWWPCRRDGDHRSAPIGRPIANTTTYILDQHLQPVPVGVPGELHLGGIQVARGYLNRMELTEECFIPDPYSEEPGACLYKTGDRALWRPDGVIEYLGRMDFQVKIRGFRIELGEIESALRGQDSVHDAVVITWDDHGGDPVLAAYIVPENVEPSSPELRNALRKTLPEYMVPGLYTLMSSLPLSPNGKIDRKALPVPEIDRSGPKQGEEPRDEIEGQLCSLWAKILGRENINRGDNFFDLGGHSLLAVRLVVEIEKAYGHRLPLATFFQAPTVADLAGIVRSDNWSAVWHSLVPIRATGNKSPLYLMHSHGGNVLEYEPLAQHLGEGQPVYALQARGLDGHIPEETTIESMAEYYIGEIKASQPKGPYCVGGFCLGGFIALEVARQITRAGDEVALVILIQTAGKNDLNYENGAFSLKQVNLDIRNRFDIEKNKFMNYGSGERLKYFGDRAKRLRDVLQGRIGLLLDHFSPNSTNGDTKRSLAYILEALAFLHEDALTRYGLKPYGGRVLLLKAEHQPKGVQLDAKLGWGDLLNGKLNMEEVPGYQQSMLNEPHVAILARLVEKALEDAMNLDDQVRQTVSV